MASTLKKHFGQALSRIPEDLRPLIVDMVASLTDLQAKYDVDIAALKASLDDVKTKYEGHKHSFDGSQTTDAITHTPVTGATSGTATGGTASPLAAIPTVQTITAHGITVE